MNALARRIARLEDRLAPDEKVIVITRMPTRRRLPDWREKEETSAVAVVPEPFPFEAPAP